MKIAPIDIAHKSFGKKMMGFDADEVTDFLRSVAEELEEVIRERNELKETVRQKELNLMEYREREQVLKKTLETATVMAERMRIDAEKEAKLIAMDAQQKAEMIVRDARDSLKRLYQEMADLKRARLQFEANLKALAQAHLSILDKGERYMPEVALPNVDMVPGKGERRVTSVSSTVKNNTNNASAATQTQAKRNSDRSTEISPLSSNNRI